MERIGVCVTICQNIGAQYIAMREILDVTVVKEWIPISLESLRWWEQAGIQFGDGG